MGIARARCFLTEQSRGEYMLPLDDDDVLAANAAERLLQAAAERPWCGLVRARRGFIDDGGRPVDMADWFPFEPRRYFRGMTCDLFNHSQPAMIARWAYDRTSGWEGFPEYKQAGEDCDIFTKVEEVAEIRLLDEVLYHYRINPDRTSLGLGTGAANDMWLRIAEKTLKRRMLPMRLANRVQPFIFTRQNLHAGSLMDIDFIVRAAPACRWQPPGAAGAGGARRRRRCRPRPARRGVGGPAQRGCPRPLAPLCLLPGRRDHTAAGGRDQTPAQSSWSRTPAT